MMKKILLALALVSATSLFAANNYSNWFTASPTAAEPTWVWSGEDGSIITNTADTAYWEIDADVSKAGTDDATLFTPTTSATIDNTVTVIDIKTTFDAMYDMTTEEGHPERFIGEDQPLPPPQGSLGALIVGSTTNVDESVVSSNFYAWVWNDATSGTWFPLYGAEVPASLTGDVVNVRIELLYMGTATEGVNKLRYSIVDGQTVTALTNALGVALFDFTPGATKNLASVQFSGCGKVCGIAADVRNSEYFDGGTGSDYDPYLINTPDTFLELGVGDKRGSGRWFKLGDNLGDDITLAKWAPLAASDAASVNFDGSGKTITVDLAGDSFFGKLVNSTIKDLTIVANNASDNVLPVAVFASECSANEYGGVNFVNCTAAGTLHNIAEEAPVLAGFTLDVDVADGAGDTPPASVTFENCAVTAEFYTGIFDDPETDKVNEAYAGCYAFVANVDKGVVAATADTTLATVNKYEAYGTIATKAQEVEEEEVEEEGTVEVALGSVPKAFNFYTNGVADNVNNIYYVEPKLSPMNAESIPTYWIAKENADEFEFAEQGKLKFQYEGQKFTGEAPYDVATCVTVGESLGLVVEGYSPDDGDYGPGLPEFNENVCNVFVNPLVATMIWYYASEQVDEMPFSSFTYAVGSASTEQDYDEQVLTLTANAILIGSSEIVFEVDLGEYYLNICENDSDSGSFAFTSGGILRTATANPLENINILQRQEDPEESGAEESEEEIVENNVIFYGGATVYGKKGGEDVLWLDSEPSEEEEESEEETPGSVPVTPAFAHLGGSGASIKVTNVNDTHKDFLISGSEDEGYVTIYSFDAAGGNDTYTLTEGAVVALNGSLSPARLQAPNSELCITKVEESDNLYTTGTALCMVNGKGYATFEEALAAAGDGATIGIVDGQAVEIPTVTIDKNLFITNSTGTGKLTINGEVSIAAGKTLNLSGFTLTGDDATFTFDDNGCFAIAATGTLQMDDVDPTTAFGEEYDAFFAGTANGAIFIGTTTYTWNGSEWQGEQPVVNYVCQIVVSEATTNKYETLQAAIDAATSGQTIQLIADITEEVGTYVGNNGLHMIAASKDFILDLNGYTISINKTTGGNGVWMEIAAGAKVKFSDSSEHDTGKIVFEGGEDLHEDWAAFAYLIENRGKLTIEGGTFELNLTGNWISYIVQESAHTAAADVELNFLGGVMNVKNGDAAVRFYNNSANAAYAHTFNIDGGVILAGGISIAHDNGNNNATLNIKSGEVNGYFDNQCTIDDHIAVNITGGTCHFSTLRFRNNCNSTKPFINISGGNVQIDEFIDLTTGGYKLVEITGGTFTSVAATDEKTKGFVPALVCTITDDDPEVGKYTVTKESVPLTVTKGEHVESFVYTINGQAVDANPTVVYGDIVEITDVTYAYGYQAGTVKAGDKIEMTLEKLVSEEQLVESVTITIDATERTFFGGGDGSEATPFIINVAQHLIDLKDYVAAGQPTAGKYFKQETDIDMANIDGNGTVAPPWAGIGAQYAKYNTDKVNNHAFCGIYDGGNFAIKNVKFAGVEESTGAAKRNGFFLSIDGATIKNLEINVLGFETACTTYGGAAFAGAAWSTTKDVLFENCTASGTLNVNHSVAGFICTTLDSPTITFTGCENKVTCSTTDDTAGGYICTANGGSLTFTSCTNSAAISASDNDASVSGFVAYLTGNTADNLTFTDCANSGALTGTTKDVGSFVGRFNTSNWKAVVNGGNNTAQADKKSVGYYAAEYSKDVPNGLTFATVDNGVATFVADDVFLSAINDTAADYKLMASGGTAMLEAGTWKFDVSLFNAEALKVATDTNINAAPTKSEADANNIVTVTVTPLEKSAGVFEVVATRDSAGTTGDIKLTDGDVKNVPGYETKSLADVASDAAFQTALNEVSDGVPLWQKLVLGLSGDQKPTVKATQDAATETVTFTLGTLKSVEQIRATGAKVKFYVDDLLGGELKEVGDTLTLPISSLFSDENKVERITVKVVIDQANQKPQAANDNN